MIPRSVQKERQPYPEDSLTYSITSERRISTVPEQRFRDALEAVPTQWIGMTRGISRLRERGARVDIYVSIGDSRVADLGKVVTAFQNFASTLKPDRLTLHMVSASQTTPADLRRQISDPRTNPYSTLIWDEPLNR